MSKTILITGATDGIGRLTAKKLAEQGHKVLLHGRSSSKLEATQADVGGDTETYVADFARMSDIKTMSDQILERHKQLDVLINNAGVLKTSHPRTPDGFDVRFVVNTVAPYVLTKCLLPIIPKSGRIVNLSSAAQAPVNVTAMTEGADLEDMAAYAQSKLAITIWSRELAAELSDGPLVVAVNPGSLLASKMVKEGFGVAGNDLGIGADILCEAALGSSFADATGKYFDNDSGRFAQPNAAALDPNHAQQVWKAVEQLSISMP